MKGRRARGAEAEELACRYLASKGFTVLERNYTTRFGEIDIVAAKGNTTYFIEVRSINSRLISHPAETITARKLQHLRRAVYSYIKTHRLQNYRTLFIGIDFSRNPPSITEIYDFLEEV